MLKEKSMAAQSIDAPERRRLPPLLRRAWYGLNQAFRPRIAHLGVTPDQFTEMRLACSFPARNLRGGEQIYPASVIKLFDLVASQRWMEDGKLKDTEEPRRAI